MLTASAGRILGLEAFPAYPTSRRDRLLAETGQTLLAACTDEPR